ncbi:hypothetical protein BDE40_1862 [Litoreibacter halocynthiae]|uniref:DUF91 domain-containing protein n=1 Tax=Litoreibacter halocynthiae TaxID=1242689 RepID=A0A4R7LKD6_9RHOB|nr:hypothetical protein [Litoreibacter halocynthiae]TDT75136.1 hypothetical protein BDE40_1862 [Litoreibacter halocynthiae]
MFVSSQLVLNEQILSPAPYTRELMLQAFLIENVSLLRLNDAEYSEPNVLTEELALKGAGRSKDGDGRIDVLVSYEPGTYGVVELKNGPINESHVDQLTRYLEAQTELNYYIEELDGTSINDFSLVGVLVGTDITSGLRNRVEDGATISVNGQMIPLAAIAVRRFRSKNNDVLISIDTFFKTPSGRYYTKYEFNDKVYAKGRLALAIVREIALKNSVHDSDALDHILGRETHKNGMFDNLEIARSIANADRKRHFIAEDEAISLGNGERIAVSNQWGLDNLQPLLKLAEKRGMTIKVVR